MSGIIRETNSMDLSKYFLQNIDNISMKKTEEEYINSYKNNNIYPPFRHYKDSSHLNFTPKIYPDSDMTYANKQIFKTEKPIQTEHDEIPINIAALDKFSGYTNYGNYYYQNQSLPERLAHKKLPKSNNFDLVY